MICCATDDGSAMGKAQKATLPSCCGPTSVETIKKTGGMRSPIRKLKYAAASALPQNPNRQRVAVTAAVPLESAKVMRLITATIVMMRRISRTFTRLVEADSRSGSPPDSDQIRIVDRTTDRIAMIGVSSLRSPIKLGSWTPRSPTRTRAMRRQRKSEPSDG